MSSISDCFYNNFRFLKYFGIWPGKEITKQYRYYSVIFIFITLIAYNLLLILNLAYTPKKMELIIREVIFLFTEVAVVAKVVMIMRMRKKLLTVCDILDYKQFQGNDDVAKQIVHDHVTKYKTYWKMYVTLCHFVYFCRFTVPVLVHFIFKTNIELPLCKYYFLDVNVVQKYFAVLYLYQSFGMYGHMTYNINVDTLIAGLILMAIMQVRVINYYFRTLKAENIEQPERSADKKLIAQLNVYLMHYEILLKYCSLIQEIMSVTLFIQFGMTSATICFVLCGLLLPSTTEFLIFMISYLLTMILEIFVPAWLGSILIYESRDLIFAAYSGEWIPRSERYKRSIKLFVERANRQIEITGCGLFPLSLYTFTSIMKTAYSFFTLIRNFQEPQD